jgi:Flp pilus assembly protein TadG
MKLASHLHWKSEEGSNLVEFTLVSVMFIIVMLSIVEIGRMVLVYTTMANAARAGARYAIVHGGERTGAGANGPSGPGSTTQVETVVKNFASAGLLDTSLKSISVTYPNGLNTAGSPVMVTVSYTYDPLIAYFNTILGTTLGSTSEGVITF